MGTVTRQSESLRAAIACHRDALDAILARYAATNPRIFGSVARGDATPDSDIDLATKDPFGNCTNGIDRITTLRGTAANDYSKLDPDV